MSYVLDSSAIFKAIRTGAVEALAGNYTLELARYELGNILWKEHNLHKRINIEELKQLILLIKRALNLMEFMGLECREEKVLSVAERLKVTFYDASYIVCAQEKGMPLTTEDENLISKAGNYIKVARLNVP